MNRYIDAYEVKRQIQKATEGEVDVMKVFLKTMYSIDKIPTADVRENVRGAWLKGEYYSNGYKEEWIFPYCSICHYETDKMYKFCPNCGAEMRKGGAE